MSIIISRVLLFYILLKAEIRSVKYFEIIIFNHILISFFSYFFPTYIIYRALNKVFFHEYVHLIYVLLKSMRHTLIMEWVRIFIETSARQFCF